VWKERDPQRTRYVAIKVTKVELTERFTRCGANGRTAKPPQHQMIETKATRASYAPLTESSRLQRRECQLFGRAAWSMRFLAMNAIPSSIVARRITAAGSGAETTVRVNAGPLLVSATS
jgi:hypothetical protein